MSQKTIKTLIIMAIILTFLLEYQFADKLKAKISDANTMHTESTVDTFESGKGTGNEDSADSAQAAARKASAPLAEQAENAVNSSVENTQEGKLVTLKNGDIKLEYDLNIGTADFYYQGNRVITKFYSGVKTNRLITSKEYTVRTVSTSGSETVITSKKSGSPLMKQIFSMKGNNSFLVKVTLEGSDLSSNWMGPIMADTKGSVDIGSYNDNRALFVPFDNDKWVRFNAGSINREDVSYEVSAFYDNSSRHGLVIGSVSHDVWKTAVSFAGEQDRLDMLYVYGGASSSYTRDVSSHGSIKGNSISSPQVFVGFYEDWRTGMEEYAQANAGITEKMEWDGEVPFGWNSWGKLKSTLSYDKAVNVSDFVAEQLQNNGFSNDNTVYINLDSYWDNMTDKQLADFVANCRKNGQKAGIYWAPFVDWAKSQWRQVEGSNYSYRDIWLKTSEGKPIELDGAYALDPTHPGTKARIDYFINKFKTAGFDYIKLDFLTHGSIEGGSNNGVHYDDTVQTGIQAYNQGMSYLKKKINGQMFTSLAISPVFPTQYAHARRIASDTFGSIKETEYLLNSVSYGWWLSDSLYKYNDPDHLVLEGYTADENRSRVTSAVVAGTVFLNGDDLTKTQGQQLAKQYLTNAAVNAVAKIGKPFVSVEANTGMNAADTFVLKEGNTFYIAVFNYSDISVSKRLNLGRAGLDSFAMYKVTDLWEGSKTTVSGNLKSDINAKGVKLYRLDKAS